MAHPCVGNVLQGRTASSYPCSGAFIRCRKTFKKCLRVRAEKDGDGVVNEDILAKLKAAEEEAQRLKKELADAKSKAGVAAPSADASETKPSRRIDSGDLRRETLFSESKQRTNWLNESDVNFFTGGGPTELEEGGASTDEQQGIVVRRLIIGLGLTAAVGAFALVPTEKLSPPPSKPLFFYLVPLLRVQELLKQAEAAAPEGDYAQLKAITARILGSPNDLQENLRNAASSLPDSRAVSTAEAVGREVYECVEQIDFNRYFDTLGAPGSMGGKVEKQLFDFSQQSAKAAQIKLKEFLALMPRDQLEAAQQQVNTSPF